MPPARIAGNVALSLATQADERLLAPVRLAVRLHGGVAARARGHRRRRAVPALRLSQRSAGAAERGAAARVRRAGARDLRAELALGHPAVDGGLSDVVRAGALVAAAPLAKRATPVEVGAGWCRRRAATSGVRVGVLTTSYPRDEDDAAGAFVAGFARWLAANVGDVEVVCADEARPLFYRGGAPEALTSRRRWGEAAAFSARLLIEARAARARLGRGGVALAGAVGRGRRRRCAATGRHLAIAHGSDVRLLSSAAGRAGAGAATARGAPIWSTSPMRCASTGAPGRVVPMAIDVAPIAPATTAAARDGGAARGSSVDGFVVAFLGRLIHDKGVDRADRRAARRRRRCSSPATAPSAASLVRRAARPARALRRARRGRRQARAARRRRCARDSLARRRRADGGAGRRSPPACRSSPRAPAACPSCSTTRSRSSATRSDELVAALARLRDDARAARNDVARLPRARARDTTGAHVAPHAVESIGTTPNAGCLRTIRV